MVFGLKCFTQKQIFVYIISVAVFVHINNKAKNILSHRVTHLVLGCANGLF